ncbi:hemin-degrading factor [Devosia sp.]|uniref:hemin-degrading factor n=1 Tax=Devosia sp. TaxID=1871048 RepID=UPI003BA8F96C
MPLDKETAAVTQAHPLPPAEIRHLRAQHAEMRERDFARIHRISEAELVAAYVGEGVVALRPDVATLLAGAAALGEVLALTRNESAVHEKIGPFEKTNFGEAASIALGKQIDLRIFPKAWASGFAVEKADKEGATKRSLQFFDGAGDAVFKIHLRPASNLEAYDQLVAQLRTEEQSQTVSVAPIEESEAVRPDAASAGELRAHWEKLTDTHQFFPMLRKLHLTRHQAVSMIDSEFATSLDLGATRALFDGAAASGVSIMVFIGSRGCIQIHTGPIHKVAPMGPWLNVMDETFHMHLRLDQITEVWAVRKPTADGHVTSFEAYGADKKLIIQCFGERHEGDAELTGWRGLIAGLPALDRSNAA